MRHFEISSNIHQPVIEQSYHKDEPNFHKKIMGNLHFAQIWDGKFF